MADLLAASVREAALACEMAEVAFYTRHGDELALAYRYDARRDRSHAGESRRVLVAPATPEGEMVRRGVPILVPAGRAPDEGLLARYPAAGYVAVPITADGMSVAVLVATSNAERGPDQADADGVVDFAERLGWLIERLALREQASRQMADAKAALQTAWRALDGPGGRGLPLSFTAPEGHQVEVLRPSVVQPQSDPELTQREREVMAHMALGQTNRAIAAELFLSEGTVKCHVKHILRKLGVANRAEAVARHLGAGPRPALFGPPPAGEPDSIALVG